MRLRRLVLLPITATMTMTSRITPANTTTPVLSTMSSTTTTAAAGGAAGFPFISRRPDVVFLSSLRFVLSTFVRSREQHPELKKPDGES